MKIVFFSATLYDKNSFNHVNSSRGSDAHEILYFEQQLNEKSAPLAEGADVVCMFVNDRANGSVIGRLKIMGVKLIALRCAGFNNIDLEAASQAEIPVVRVPEYSPYAVAEHVVALIMTLNRKIHKAYNRVREGNFTLDRLEGFDLYGKTVGVIGTGKIGQVFAKIMQGFGCNIMAYDIFENEELKKKGVTYAPMNDVLEGSDIISLHCPLIPQTRHLINEKTIEFMKPKAMLINAGRGGLIDTAAVVTALQEGKLGSLGLDVYEQEEELFFRDYSGLVLQDNMIMLLMSLPNVLITSHQAFLTYEALQKIATVTLDNCSDFCKGAKLENQVFST